MRPRVIPALLLAEGGLVKTTRFKNPVYIGDPINVVRIFNDKEVDELLLLDTRATIDGLGPPFELLEQVASECFMPVCYGGGIRTVDEVRQVVALGIEKVAINTRAVEDSDLVRRAAGEVGSASVVVAIDARRTLLGGYEVVTHGGRKRTGRDPVQHARDAERQGAGELLINSIDRDGTMKGYDLTLVREVADAVKVPVIALGGAGSVQDLGDAVKVAGASAVAAGSLFVFQGRHRAVLVNTPPEQELRAIFAS